MSRRSFSLGSAFALSAILAAAALSGPLGRWFAVAGLIYLGPALAHSFAAHAPGLARRGRDLRTHAPLVLSVAVFAGLLFPIWLGEPPASRDHAVHYMQSRVFVEQLLEHGRLRGPSFVLNSGYPFGDSYPVFAYAWTSALHLLSAKLIPLRSSYAIGVAAVWALHTWAVATLARRLYLRVLPAPREGDSMASWAMATAAVAFLLDPGAARQGGWNYAMFHGVWPQLLSTALWLASWEFGFRALRRPSLRRAGLFALVLGASIVAHPFGWITAAASFVAWPLLYAFAGGQERWAPGAWRAIAWGLGLAAVACAHAVLTFMLSRDAMARVPVPFEGLGTLVGQLLSGEIFTASRALTAVAAIVGMGAALARRRVLPVAFVLAFAGTLLLASRESITVLRLDLLVSGLSNLQFPRYAFALKALWFVFAGVGAALALSMFARLRQLGAQRADTPPRGGPWPSAARAAVALALAPLLAALLAQPDALVQRPVGATETLLEHSAAEVDLALTEAFAAEREAGRPLGRVAFFRRGMKGATYPLFAIVDAGATVALDRHVPAVNYRHRLLARQGPSLRAMGVTHVIYGPALTAADAELAEQLEAIEDPRLARHGWQLARLRRAEARSLPWAKLREAEGRVRLEPIEEGEGHGWRIEIDRSERPVDLQIAVGAYRSWVMRDAKGAVVETFAVNLAGGVPGMRAELAPGVYSLRWERTGGERVSGWFSALAWIIALVALAFPRPWPPTRARSLGLATHPRRVAVLAAVVALLLFALHRRQELRQSANWRPLFGDRPGEIVDLVDAGRLWVDPRGDASCSGLEGRDAREDCRPSEREAYVDFLYRRPRLYRCTSIELAPGQRREIFALESRRHGELVAFAAADARAKIKLGVVGETGVKVEPAARRRVELPRLDPSEASYPRLWVRNGGDAPARVCVAAAMRVVTGP